MTAPIRPIAVIVFSLCLSLGWDVPRVLGQETDDAFGEGGDAPAAAAPAAAKPAAAAPSKDKKDSEEPPPPDEPAVQAILESMPKTAPDKLRAAQVLVDLNRPDLAKPLLKQLLTPPLKPAAAYALVRRFGSATFFKLASNQDLTPEGQQFADFILAAAEKYRDDPDRLTALAARLADKSQTQREDAMAALEDARGQAVGPLLHVLADPGKAVAHPAVRELLVRLEDDAVGPLMGVLESNDAALKVQVVDVLGQLGAKQAMDALYLPLLSAKSSTALRTAAARALLQIVGSLPTLGDAQTLLRRDLLDHLDRSRLAAAEPQATVEVWEWNVKRKQSEPLKYRASDAELALAARLGRDLYELDPTNLTNRRLYLTALLGAARYANGLDKPLPTTPGGAYAIAAAMGADAIDDFLGYALSANRPAAATAAAQILGDIGGPNLLERSGPALSPLAKAARGSDPRLRFSAVDAILKLKPTRAFAGSSAVPEALGFFAASSGVRRALVGYPNPEQAQVLVGFLAELGYECDAWTTSRRLFEMATTSPDYDFVLLHTALRHPPTEELVVQLRRDPRTASLPIGLIASSGDLPRARRLAERAGLATVFPRPHELEAVKFDVAALHALQERDVMLPEERQSRAAAALDWLAALSEKPQSLFDLRRQLPLVEIALYAPEHGAKAALVVGNLGTADGQHALVELAALATQPLPNRHAAAVAFSRSVDRYGLLLTQDQITTLYDRYNANAGEDPDTHAMLTSVLDTIDRKQAGGQVGGQRK